MKDQLISLETAKLAKEKGCKLDLHTSDWTWTDEHGDVYVSNAKNKPNEDAVLAIKCTQSLLKKWILDKHYIHVYLITDWVAWECIISTPDQPDIQAKQDDGKAFFGWNHQALEKGLQEALKLIQ